MSTVKVTRVHIGLVLALVSLLTLLVIDTPRTRAKSKANTRAGVYAIRWDFDKDGTPDLQTFASLLKSGELVMSGPLLPTSHAGQGTPRHLANGHGTWRYLQSVNKYSFTVLFNDTEGSEKVFQLSGRVPAGDDNTFDGTLTLKRFVDIDAETPEASQTLGFIGGTGDGQGI